MLWVHPLRSQHSRQGNRKNVRPTVVGAEAPTWENLRAVMASCYREGMNWTIRPWWRQTKIPTCLRCMGNLYPMHLCLHQHRSTPWKRQTTNLMLIRMPSSHKYSIKHRSSWRRTYFLPPLSTSVLYRLGIGGENPPPKATSCGHKASLLCLCMCVEPQ